MADDALIKAMCKSYVGVIGGTATHSAMSAALSVARKEILEEAAKVASANEDKYQNPTEYDYGAQICSREIAAAIRSLANQEQTNG